MSNYSRGLMAAVVLVLAVAARAPSASAAIIAGQIDNFGGGSLHNWTAGAVNPNPPTNIATGGPAGVGDGYMRLSSNGGPSAGGKLVAFNTSQWAGDYLAAGVNAVRMNVNNLGATSLSLRLILVGSQSLTTVADVNLPAGSGWTIVNFPLTPANLSGGDYNTGMSAVTELNLVHSPAVISSRGFAPNIAAQLGIDNITAVPEPAAFALALPLALAGLSSSPRPRRGASPGRAARPGRV